MLIFQSPHCYMTTGRHGILVRDWMPDLCTQGLLDHVRLNTGWPPNSSLFVVSVYKISNRKIKSKVKDFGVTFDQNLTFRPHIESKIKTASRILALIRQWFKYLDKRTLILLDKSAGKIPQTASKYGCQVFWILGYLNACQV